MRGLINCAPAPCHGINVVAGGSLFLEAPRGLVPFRAIFQGPLSNPSFAPHSSMQSQHRRRCWQPSLAPRAIRLQISANDTAL